MPSNYERLQAWGITADERDDLGLGFWVEGFEGIADLDTDDTMIIDKDTTVDDLILWANNTPDEWITLTPQALETRLHHSHGGWSTNVKLHDAYVYARLWENLFPDLDNHDGNLDWDWIYEAASEGYEFFLDTLPSGLDATRFSLEGRQGGWLVYSEEYMSLRAADALYNLYTNHVPLHVLSISQEVAIREVAARLNLARNWIVEVESESRLLVQTDNATITLEVKMECKCDTIGSRCPDPVCQLRYQQR